MERNMHKRVYGISRESSPSGRHHSISSNADNTRKSLFGGNAIHGCSPVSGNLKKTASHNSRLSLSARSTTQSIPGIRSDYNIVETYGNPLPVAVNEALTFAGAGANSISAKITQSGWAWIVQGRRLLIWQYKDKTGSPPRQAKHQRRAVSSAQCRELTLPFSDIVHKSELVSVFHIDGHQMASCIAISATGDVRYWTSIAHDNNSVDISILAGQQFVKLLNLPTQNGYIAVTSTCTLVFLRVCLTNGRHTLHHKTIKPTTGFLGGFSKRVASMLIGMQSGSDRDQLIVGMCTESDRPTGESIVAVLSDRGIQRWCISNKGNSEQLIYEDVGLIRKIREMMLQKFWNVRLPNDNVEIELRFLDFQVCRGNYYILVGAVNQAHTPQMYYAIVVGSPEAESIQLDCFTPLKLNKFFSAKTEQECLSVRIIVGPSHMYLYTPKVVYPLLLSNAAPTAEMETEKVEFHLHDDGILSAAICDHLPLFFSRTHGLVSIMPGDFDSNDLLHMSACNTPDLFAPISFNANFSTQDQSAMHDSFSGLPMHQIDPDDVYAEFNNDVGQLKAAFLYSIKRNTIMANTIIADLMESINETDSKGAPIDAYKLDRIVITIAEDLAEDLPIADPRWQYAIEENDSNRYALGSSRSMNIINQLRDKSIAMQHFIEFLHCSNIWEKLNAVPCGSNVLKPTSYILTDISEKIVGAMALRGIQNKMSKLVEEAIDITVARWKEVPNGSITTQDIFFVKICKFQNIFESLVDMAENSVTGQNRTTAAVAQIIRDINTIVLGILDQVLKFREQNASNYKQPAHPHENQPWTATPGPVGVLDALTRLIEITVHYATQCVTDLELKHMLCQQIYELADILLEARKNYLDSVKDSEKFHVLQQQFETQRHHLISSLINERQYTCATKLAEKYLDFRSLVVICDETKDKSRLDEYTEKFEEYDFSQFAINWHLRQQRHGEVFERFKGNQTALAQFMSDHPSLGWIQLIFNGDFERAAKVLYEIALCEIEFVARKKSMLSLAKLAALTVADVDMSAYVEKINFELTIIEYQSHLSHDVLQNFGFDATDQKVLKVEELINLFIAEENDTVTEVEFRKALDLLNYVDQPYDLRHKIWCAIIRRDNWLDYDSNKAVEYIHKLMFYKVIELSQLMGEECDTLLPPMEDFLDSAELGDLPHQKLFQYLLKLVYEYTSDMFKSPENMEM